MTDGDGMDWPPATSRRMPIGTAMHQFAELYGVDYERAEMAIVMSNPVSAVDTAVHAEMEKRRVEKEVERKLRLIDGFGVDSYNEGAVITFTKRFTTNGIEYKYAAIKVHDAWYTTGPKAPKAYSWDELVTWLVAGEAPTTEVTLMLPITSMQGKEPLTVHETWPTDLVPKNVELTRHEITSARRREDEIPF